MNQPKPAFAPSTFGELEPGDVILGPKGESVTIEAVHDVHVPLSMYEIELEDGTKVEASGNHLWYIEPQNDVWHHQERLKQGKKLLNQDRTWMEEARAIALDDQLFEIGMEDLMNFLDFIEDETVRYLLIRRTVDSLGHIVEETKTYQDYATHEQSASVVEKVYSANLVFQQLLSLADAGVGRKKFRKRWPVILGRVVTTEELFSTYPDAEIPTFTRKASGRTGK